MEQFISRYNLNKEFIARGVLTIKDAGQATILTYEDESVKESVSELNHPLKALESLRIVLENKYSSVIACTGCRIDSAYRFTGGYATYILYHGKPGTEIADLFEPTTDASKLCTVEEHKAAYRKWLDSLGINIA